VAGSLRAALAGALDSGRWRVLTRCRGLAEEGGEGSHGPARALSISPAASAASKTARTAVVACSNGFAEVALNHARNDRKRLREAREVLVGLAEDLPEQEDGTSPETLMQAVYGMFRLKRFLEKIRPRIWATVIPYLEGRSNTEIATSLGIKVKTAHSRLHLARKHLETLALA